MYRYKITNNGDPAVITASIKQLNENAVVDDDTFVPEHWIKLINSDVSLNKPFFLPGGGRKELLLKISPDAQTLQSDYYRALTLTTSANPSTDATTTQISETLATPLLITVSLGELKKEATISKFSLPFIIDRYVKMPAV